MYLSRVKLEKYYHFNRYYHFTSFPNVTIVLVVELGTYYILLYKKRKEKIQKSTIK